MGLSNSTNRLLKASGLVLLFSLLSVIGADAAPITRHASAGVLCDTQTVTLRKLRKQVKAFGGPLKRLIKRRALTGLNDTGPRLVANKRGVRVDDDLAIQNDAPAARIDDHDRGLPELQPQGLLPGAQHAQPRTCSFSPRSPRGPPLDA